jgi:hypothetical protein
MKLDTDDSSRVRLDSPILKQGIIIADLPGKNGSRPSNPLTDIT